MEKNDDKSRHDAQIIFDAHAKEPKKLFKGYAVHGNTYVPIGDTVDVLPSGRYGFQFTMDGVYPYLKAISLEDVIMLPNPIYKKVVDDLKAFWGQSDAYKKHGFIPRRGIMLHGNPGTGKTCLLQVVADMLITEHDGLVFDVFNESDLRGFMGVANAIRHIEPNRKIVCLLEDGDNLMYGSKASSSLLNLLDGSAKINDIAYIMTTNYYDSLPMNIKNRPSRFNRKYEILNPTDTERKVFLQKKFPELNDKSIKALVDNSKGFTIDALKELVLSTEVLKMSMDAALKEIKGQFTFTFDAEKEAERDRVAQELVKEMADGNYERAEDFNSSKNSQQASDSVEVRDTESKEEEKPVQTTVKRKKKEDAATLDAAALEKMKKKVVALLVKHGNNPKDVEEMIKEHFEEAAKRYKSVDKIVEYIRTVY